MKVIASDDVSKFGPVLFQGHLESFKRDRLTNIFVMMFPLTGLIIIFFIVLPYIQLSDMESILLLIMLFGYIGICIYLIYSYTQYRPFTIFESGKRFQNLKFINFKDIINLERTSGGRSNTDFLTVTTSNCKFYYILPHHTNDRLDQVQDIIANSSPKLKNIENKTNNESII